MKLKIGLRLFLASVFFILGMLSGNWIAGAIGVVLCGMFLPTWKFTPGYLNSGTMSAEDELKQMKLLEKMSEQTVALLNKATQGHIKKEDFDTEIKKLNDSYKKLSDDSITELKKRVDEYAKGNQDAIDAATKAQEEVKELKLDLKKFQEKAIDPSNKDKVTSFRQALKDAFNEMNTKTGGAVIKTIKDSNGERLSMSEYFQNGGKQAVTPVMQIKTLVDMLESSIVQNQVQLVRLTELDPNRVGFPLNPYQHAVAIFPIKNMAKPAMSILVAYEYENGAGAKTEGSAPSKSSFKLKTVEFKACVIATYFTLSEETLDDLEEVMDEIAIIAPDKILDNFDDKVFRTTGADDSTDILGLFSSSKSTAFAFNTYIGEFELGNLIDLIQTMKLQAEGNGYRPDMVGLHPRDLNKLAAEKNTLSDDLNTRRVFYDNLGQPTFVCGLKIVLNAEIAANTCFVADSRMVWIGRRKDMQLTIGYNGTDFTEGQRTVMISIRLAFGVRDPLAVIYSASNTQNIAWITHS